jgi:hypothetical protein
MSQVQKSQGHLVLGGVNFTAAACCMQEATKFCRHACRRRLECKDVNHALRIRDMEPMYGFSSSDKRRYSQVAGAPDAFRLDDTLHRCEDVISRNLPPTPVEAVLQMHWFLVNGIKPRIPENKVPRELIQWHQEKVCYCTFCTWNRNRPVRGNSVHSRSLSMSMALQDLVHKSRLVPILEPQCQPN